MTTPASARDLPAIIQGGMGVAVSNWRLAQAVARTGHLGVVSGTGIDRVVGFRLQEGDLDGGIRRVLAKFPIPAMAERVLAQWYVPGGITRRGAYRSWPMTSHTPGIDNLTLLVVGAYVEVMLAKEGHDGLIGINLLEKIQAPNLALLYGAMLAGVDVVLMGAGIPREIPGVLDRFAKHEEASLILQVDGALNGEVTRLRFAPRELIGEAQPPIHRPLFLAVVASDTLAQALVRSTDGGVNGFVIEGPTAGGHNAPPRGNSGQRNALGEPVYGPRDVVNLPRVAALGLPYWLAGGYGRPGALAAAQALGAHGIQVGTAFAFCEESGLDNDLKARALAQVRANVLRVFTDPLASPTGFPFKTFSLPDLSIERKRICNLGNLRQAYRTADGGIGWRCAAEPESIFIAKGGDPAMTDGRVCLCNGLLAAAGHPPEMADGRLEPPLLTAGDDLKDLVQFMPDSANGTYSAAQVVATLMAGPTAKA
jgi:nitronate monooxygenase